MHDSFFVLDHLPEPPCGVLGVPGEGLPVDVDDPELGGEPHPPLEVVEQRPCEVAGDPSTVVGGALQLV